MNFFDYLWKPRFCLFLFLRRSSSLYEGLYKRAAYPLILPVILRFKTLESNGWSRAGSTKDLIEGVTEGEISNIRTDALRWRFGEKHLDGVYNRSVRNEIHHPRELLLPAQQRSAGTARTLFRFMEVSEAESVYGQGGLTLSSPSSFPPPLLLLSYPFSFSSQSSSLPGCRHRLVDLLDKVVKTIKRHWNGCEIQIEV